MSQLRQSRADILDAGAEVFTAMRRDDDQFLSQIKLRPIGSPQRPFFQRILDEEHKRRFPGLPVTKTREWSTPCDSRL